MPLLQTAIGFQDLYSAIPGQSVPRPLAARAGDAPTVLEFGLNPDADDNTAALNLAWATLAANGRKPALLIPSGLGALRFKGRLTPPADASMRAIYGRAPLYFLTGSGNNGGIDANNPRFTLEGVDCQGDHSTTNYAFFINAGARGSKILDVTFSNWNSGIQCSADGCQFLLDGANLRGAMIRIAGGRFNKIAVRGTNVTNFLTYLTDGAANNDIEYSIKRVDFATLTPWQQATYASDIARGKFGIESVGVKEGCTDNNVRYYYAENTGDAGASISGDRNRVGFGFAVGCDGNALTFIGSQNSADVVIGIGNKRALACIPTAGGLTKDNFAARVVAINNWFAGISVEKTQLRLFEPNTTKTPGSSFVRFGLNNYQTEDSTSVTTYGPNPPVHTSGVVSDGINRWRYISSDPVTLDPDRNQVGAYFVSGNGAGRDDKQGLNAGSGVDIYAEPGIQGAATIGGRVLGLLREPAAPAALDEAMSDGSTVNAATGWGASGAGRYQFSGGKWRPLFRPLERTFLALPGAATVGAGVSFVVTDRNYRLATSNGTTWVDQTGAQMT